ncbi:hypothetical protein KIN20_018941 [Parelaphostrongylus tenuis]|uniref:Uncharacterized protein n=1 Tax=Parelaphostrongylus tenuis TaxID=148309 RepID=A0AAD5N4A3_PARTN|nr:hypothetical protein KIN20_018941 [Parelaphostrongylus tenuis]
MIYASTRLGSCTFSPLNDFHLSEALSRPLEQGHLAVKLAGSRPSGLLCVIYVVLEEKESITRYIDVDALETALTCAHDDYGNVCEHRWKFSQAIS